MLHLSITGEFVVRLFEVSDQALLLGQGFTQVLDLSFL